MKKVFKKIVLMVLAVVLCYVNFCFAKATDSEIAKENISSVSEVEELSIEDVSTDEIYDENQKADFDEEPEEDESFASPSETDEVDCSDEAGSDEELEEKTEKNSDSELEEKNRNLKTTMFGAGSTYNTDQFLNGIESVKPSVLGSVGNSNITKITFGKGGTVPSGEKIREVAGDTGVYLSGTEITVYTANADDVIKLSSFSWSGGRGFSNFTNLVSIEGLENLDATSTHDFTRIFQFNYKLESIDLSKLGNVTATETTMMFLDCESLQTINVGTTFNTSSATEMGSMFDGCKSLSSIDVEHINTHSSKTLQYFFADCESLTSADLSSLDMQNVITMYSMFEGCKNIETIKLPSTNAPTLSSIGLTCTFSGCENLQTLDLGNMNTAGVQIYDEIFNNCKKLTSVDLSNFNTVNAISFNSAFENCTALTSLDLTSFYTKDCDQMKNMFKGCTNLTEIKVSSDFVVAPVSAGYASGVPATGNVGIFTYTTGYIITFDANGGSGSMLPQVARAGEDTILNGITFTRSEYAFSSWLATDSNTYANGANIGVVTHDMTLTAQWTYVGGSSNGGYRRYGGGSGGGGGGGRKSAAMPTSVPITINNTTATKAANSMAIDSSLANIIKDPVTGKCKMDITFNGANITASKIFITLNTIKVDMIDGTEKLTQISDTYFFN